MKPFKKDFPLSPLHGLPMIRKSREAIFSLKFRDWIEKNPRYSCALELKDTRGKNYLLFKEVKQIQIDYGLRIKSKRGVLLRVEAIFEGMPDYIWCRELPAYIVIKYPKCFVMIDVETFDIESKRSNRRSLTEARAKELAIIVIPN